MLKDYIISTAAFEKAHALIKKRKLWKKILLPGLVFLVFFLFGFYFFANTVGKVVNQQVLEEFGLEKWLDDRDSGMLRFIFSFTGLVVWMVGALFYFSLFKYGWLLVASPFSGKLSSQAVQWVTPQFIKEEETYIGRPYVLKSIQITLANMGWQSVYYIAFFILAFIPVIGWVVPIFALLMEAYFLGFTMLDYVFRARGLAHAEVRRIIGNRKGLAVGNGFMFYLMMLVPVIGWVLVPAYAMLAAAFTVSEVAESS